MIDKILKSFENSECANVEICYCSVDDEYEVKLNSRHKNMTIYNKSLDAALLEILEYVESDQSLDSILNGL